MRALSGGEWRDGLLDYWRGPGEARVGAKAWLNVGRLKDLYFVRPKSPRLLLNYLREVGPVEVARKVRSRSAEARRNEKFVSYGLGEILEPPEGEEHRAGEQVAFIAPCHPACVERLVLPPGLLFEVDRSLLPPLRDDRLLYLTGDGSPSVLRPPIAGWTRHAGIPLDGTVLVEAAADAAEALTGARWGEARTLELDPVAPRERTGAPAPAPVEGPAKRRERPSAVLFGYGNYAKTHLLPRVRESLDVRCIHELDPLQIPVPTEASARWDTAPRLREDERYDAHLIAGYHSTHAPLAIAALEQGASAAVEKPLAVDEDQLERLVATLESSAGELFACFQRRYSPLNELARKDLGVPWGVPISYHCIVYEVPLPQLHWYRWPSSGSRLLSNGCHWIDHFLYLNDFADVRAHDLFAAGDSTINCSLELENGAVFTMALTDRGSPRIGVQDHVELRAGDVTVKILNNSRYRSENSRKRLRRAGASRAESYVRMYSEIARRIRDKERGDSASALRASAGTVIALDRLLTQTVGHEDVAGGIG